MGPSPPDASLVVIKLPIPAVVVWLVQIKGILTPVKSRVISLNNPLISLDLIPISIAVLPFSASADSFIVVSIPKESNTNRILGSPPSLRIILTLSTRLATNILKSEIDFIG